MDILIPPRQPSTNGTSASVQPRLNTAKFGDGYKVDQPDGPVPLERTQTLVWEPIAPAEADAIIAFLQAHVGVPFYYRLPRELAPRSWIWTQYSRTYPQPNWDSLQVSLEQRLVW